MKPDASVNPLGAEEERRAAGDDRGQAVRQRGRLERAALRGTHSMPYVPRSGSVGSASGASPTSAQRKICSMRCAYCLLYTSDAADD